MPEQQGRAVLDLSMSGDHARAPARGSPLGGRIPPKQALRLVDSIRYIPDPLSAAFNVRDDTNGGSAGGLSN
jgi:hypothetical protein